ncbi:CaiB/BaiF CoA transferase family protein [Serpentinicella alkaliphila]|uniref:CoA:oxalate CoA-transferase n=1 Tax=Serpentinicella alkaliphila TaxID=1734049 RepID=A0A4R2TH16_9FIRM|nr:CoA transferase [Serpentinicella alkaliphila]QUH24945.1 CoA transferase [Serpentinicella alkaliphila]TCQ02748.1 CoA:oxalate CoA-transferase [Serpentinicella alkaliphila]
MNLLEGVKVIDFTHAYAGPFCTLNLADFGAEVIKIERIEGDVSRGWGPFKNNYSGYYSSFNRGKKSITLNIKSEEGKKIIFDLVKDADIVCSNFKAGTLENYGIGYEQMKEIKPDIIYASISGFGDSGVLSKFAAYDNVVQAMSGIMDLTGFPEGDPTKIGPAIGDSYTGLMLLLGITTAYYNKLETGKGQKVEVTMLGSLIQMATNPILEYTAFGKIISRMGNMNAHYAPCDVYKVKDGYVSIAVKNDKMWKEFCNVLNGPDIHSDQKFKDNEARIKNNLELKEIIEDSFTEKTRNEVVEKLEKIGIPVASVQNIQEAFENPHLKARDMIIELNDPGLGKIKLVGNPIKLSENPPAIKISSPLLGEHTEDILTKMGFTVEEVQNLRSKKVV